MTTTAAVTAAEAVLDTIDMLLGAVDVDLALARDVQADLILAAGVDDAIASIRADRPGFARFQLEAARLRAQHVLDGGDLAGGDMAGAAR
ncbi:MAG TPA: hypothetical protein VGE38_07015 [Nocardioides sp.]|uniref:hypothetical protein n=1 Tax=Nocardioides sp. TaxID=35761 RepID=UPI002EDB6C1A